MSKLKAVLFDLDGTLRDTTEIVYVAIEETLEHHDVPKPTREELYPHIHHHSIVHSVFSPHIDYEPWLAVYREKLGLGWMDAPFHDGTEKLLAELQSEGYQLAIVTSAEYDRTKEYLRYRGIDGYFSAVAAVREGVRPKPEPDLIHDALDQLGYQAHQAIMVGDMMADVEAAHAAGVKCVGITHGFSTRKDLKKAGADYMIDYLSEVPLVLAAEAAK